MALLVLRSRGVTFKRLVGRSHTSLKRDVAVPFHAFLLWFSASPPWAGRWCWGGGYKNKTDANWISAILLKQVVSVHLQAVWPLETVSAVRQHRHTFGVTLPSRCHVAVFLRRMIKYLFCSTSSSHLAVNGKLNELLMVSYWFLLLIAESHGKPVFVTCSVRPVFAVFTFAFQNVLQINTQWLWALAAAEQTLM